MQLEVYSSSESSVPLTTLEFRPGKIIGVGRNYRAHASELGNVVPKEPLLFFKPASAVIETGGTILRPDYDRVDFEGELGVVIAKRASKVRDNPLDYVLGLTCVNDVTIRDLQKRDPQWTRAKGFDTSCPVGPRVVSGLDWANLSLETRVNGVIRQRGHTSEMVFGIPELIAYISELITLEPGDLICTGTPAGTGNLESGDRVEVDITGIGVLENIVGTAE